MKNRLSRAFDTKTGRTVMLAFDHGNIHGPTTGLERIDLNIAPLAEYADVLMATRGATRSSISPPPKSRLCCASRAATRSSVSFPRRLWPSTSGTRCG